MKLILILLSCSLLSVSCSTSQRRPSSVDTPKGAFKFVYFGDDDESDVTSLRYKNVSDGLQRFTKILKDECNIDFKYTMEKQDELDFKDLIEFPRGAKNYQTEDGEISFNYDQYSLYKEFKQQKLEKKKNEIFIIKTKNLAMMDHYGRPAKVCGYANPEVQFEPSVPDTVKNIIKNTIVFNSNQESCPKDFSFVISHETAHLFLQDNPAHGISDDLEYSYDAPRGNLIAMEEGGKSLSRKYQCPKIKKTIVDLIGDNSNE